MQNIGSAFGIQQAVQTGFYQSRATDDKAAELDQGQLLQLENFMRNDLVFSAFKLLNAGILFSQMSIRKDGKQMKPTMTMFVKKYWIPIASKIPMYLKTYGFVPIAIRREKVKYAKDFEGMFPKDENGHTETFVPYIPLMESITVEVKIKKGYPEFVPKWKDKEQESKRLFIMFGAAFPDYDTRTRTILSDMYKILPRFRQMESVDKHIMSNMTKQVNPSLVIQRRDLSTEEERIRSQNSDHQYHNGKFGDYTIDEDEDPFNLKSTEDIKDVYDKTIVGDFVTSTNNVSLLREDFNVVQQIPTGQFPTNDYEFARNWFLIDLCCVLNIPPNYFVINRTKNVNDVNGDRIKLLEARQNLVHEIVPIIKQIWQVIYSEEVDVILDILPAVSSNDYLKYLALGLLDPKAEEVTTTFYHLSGVRISDFAVSDPEALQDAFASDLRMKQLRKVGETHENPEIKRHKHHKS